MSNATFSVNCPYDDCQNTLALPATSEIGDVIVCRTNAEGLTGCNRNTEVKNIVKDESGNIASADLSTLEIDEDWGQ
ncbi:MAG: hypothetical protein Q8P32_00245 [Candidatus Komeilibacteria bacterium]|nr:hypothetical protein [Candidatus Komeilibacteria bacterium]